MQPRSIQIPMVRVALSAALLLAMGAPSLARPAHPAVSPSDARAFRVLDANRDGNLSYKEFVAGRMAEVRFVKAPTAREQRQLESQFLREAKELDTNRDGKISPREYGAEMDAKEGAIVGMGLCPFELCIFGNWKALERLPIYAQEGKTSRVVGQISRGEAFVAVTGNLHTLHPGEVRLLKAHTMRGPELKAHPRGYTSQRSRTSSSVTLKPGSRVEVLTSIGEGYYLVRYRGKVYEVMRFWEEPGSSRRAPGEMTRPMQNAWWVQVETRGGTRGWIRLEGNGGPKFTILDPVG